MQTTCQSNVYLTWIWIYECQKRCDLAHTRHFVNNKVVSVLKNDAMKTYSRVAVKFYVFLISALNGGEQLASCSSRFTLKKTASGTHWREEWVGTQIGLFMVSSRRIPVPTENRTMFQLENLQVDSFCKPRLFLSKSERTQTSNTVFWVVVI